MRYWWVNQNQTFHQGVTGGYLWSPERNANGARNPFYESMREVSPGDLIFSFVDRAWVPALSSHRTGGGHPDHGRLNNSNEHALHSILNT